MDLARRHFSCYTALLPGRLGVCASLCQVFLKIALLCLPRSTMLHFGSLLRFVWCCYVLCFFASPCSGLLYYVCLLTCFDFWYCFTVLCFAVFLCLLCCFTLPWESLKTCTHTHTHSALEFASFRHYAETTTPQACRNSKEVAVSVTRPSKTSVPKEQAGQQATTNQKTRDPQTW